MTQAIGRKDFFGWLKVMIFLETYVFSLQCDNFCWYIPNIENIGV